MAATANSIKYVGAKPVFAEVNRLPATWMWKMRKEITRKTKAVLLVHQIGMPADIQAFQRLADKHNRRSKMPRVRRDQLTKTKDRVPLRNWFVSPPSVK